MPELTVPHFEALLTTVREMTAEVLPQGWRVDHVESVVPDLHGHGEAKFCVQIRLAADGHTSEPVGLGHTIQERLRCTWAREDFSIEIIMLEEELQARQPQDSQMVEELLWLALALVEGESRW